MSDHRYGGPWTQVKENALRRYLKFYTKALSLQSFELWYVDAFAGSGDRVVETTSGGLFEGTITHQCDVRVDGSAKIALSICPPFDRFIFIESNATRYDALSALKNSHQLGTRIECHRGDANEKVQEICEDLRRKKGRRAVVFLDPYGMEVEWSTLETIRDTLAIDLLYLFPLSAVYRQAATDLSKVDANKENALNRIYGDNSWREAWYTESSQGDLLEAQPTGLSDILCLRP